MFTGCIHMGAPHPPRAPQGSGLGGSLAGRALRLMVLSVLTVLAPPVAASAQGIGTMQVTARVLPAATAWTGLAEVRAAARDLALARAGGPLVRRTGLVQTRAEVRRSGSRRLLLVTLQHPRN